MCTYIHTLYIYLCVYICTIISGLLTLAEICEPAGYLRLNHRYRMLSGKLLSTNRHKIVKTNDFEQDLDNGFDQNMEEISTLIYEHGIEIETRALGRLDEMVALLTEVIICTYIYMYIY
jgi:hypothetical protein